MKVKVISMSMRIERMKPGRSSRYTKVKRQQLRDQRMKITGDIE